jgi:quinol monooxygenase YgiN
VIVRIFNTAVDPEEVDEGVRLFREHVKPVMEAFDGCQEVDWYIGVEEHSGDLVDIAAVSKWDSVEQIEAATNSPEYEEALSELRQLFRQNPIVHHYRSIE